ncbi:squamous cell carcinoma antigen recognized by T-cells 3-like isoform X2 [Pomacea canaliculata]|uniref:squamous cell carcinoma antigen recognized by T-cells 3-like isoform X2 n=1 Tax=Pomacea canaliculata TaxID=400727 RepID=UPI000D73F9A1|nr:squamous cell carcinoma antigen recognized by T-cells 3-like isoform X2 [Pomacea canaliculata]
MAENMEEEMRIENKTSDEDSMSDDSDSSESDENKEQDEAYIRELEKELSKNPYVYNKHVELIKKLRETGDFQRLWSAREAMQQLFPLSEELWLEWLRDEIPLVSEQEERDKVEKLFENAVKDYLSVPIWLEYVQFAIGGMGSDDGRQRVTDVFERAVTAAGLHVTQGANIWEAYREYENAVLAGLMPQAGAVVSKEQEEAFTAQSNKIHSLFKRQLAVPLMDMEETFAEYKEWVGGLVDPEVEKAFNRALAMLEKVKPYEDELLAKHMQEPSLLEAYNKYLDFELLEGDPARIQCLFERALQENCLQPDLWLRYTKYLDEKLKIGSISMVAYERALRNVPWSAKLWCNYILMLERTSQPFETVKATMDKALAAGFTEAADYQTVWTVYCDYLRRRINWNADHDKELEVFRLSIERAVDHLYENFGTEGDPDASLRQFWANIEARHCSNLERARELWNQVMQEGYGSQASMWMAYYHLERACGDAGHCRRILQQALNSVTDWPEYITKAYIDFEREEGHLEQYELACSRCEAQLARINERRAKAAEKEAVLKEQKKQQRTVGKAQKKAEKGQENVDISKIEKVQGKDTVTRNSSEKLVGRWSATVTGAHSVNATNRKRKVEEDDGAQGFKVPALPGATLPAAKKVKQDEDLSENVDHGEFVHHDSSKDNITAFVSNLNFEVGEDRLREVFGECGEITEVRLVKNYKGKSKGYAYVEFTQPSEVLAALKKDRQMLDNRPIFVSRCEDRSSGRHQTHFKFATAMEKNKLFVRGLPFTCTVQDLEAIFGQHGKLKDVRLVTYRNGSSKGLAYIEYENEETAAQAVLKTDGQKIEDHIISVAISNPPPRKAPQGQTSQVPTLGSGKKDTEMRGKARTQVMLMPRAVQRGEVKPTKSSGPTGKSSTSAEPHSSGDTSNTSLSNADFRKMLLK